MRSMGPEKKKKEKANKWVVVLKGGRTRILSDAQSQAVAQYAREKADHV